MSRERAPGQERHLRAGADVEDAVGIEPGEAAMGLQRGVLDTLGREGALIGDGGLRRARPRRRRTRHAFPRRCCAAASATRFAVRLVGMDDRRARRDRLLGIEHRRQDLVVDLEPAAAFLGGGFGLGDDGGDLLPDEADDVVEHAGVVGVHPVLLVPRGREQRSGASSCVSTACTPGTASAARLVDRDDPARADAASAAA